MALVPNQKIQMVWCGKNRKHYENLGYTYTGLFDEFFVPPEDLSIQSNRKVLVTCDYCGNEHYITYAKHIKSGDTCINCSPLKVKETNMKKYGVDNSFKREDVKKRIKETCLNKYGVDNPQKSKAIKNKTVQTNLKRYGVENPGQSPEIKEKIKNVFMDKYGVASPYKIPEVQEKIRNSFYKNGSLPSSKGEIATVNLLKQIYGEENCFPQYPTNYYNLDCLVIKDNVKIDVEYDGIFYHSKTASFDKKRDNYHIKKGYKVFRIKSNKEIPTKQQLIKGIDFLVNSNESYYEIILDK